MNITTILLLKVLTPCFLIVLTAVHLIRDWKYHDKRSLKYHKITRIILATYLIPILFSGLVPYLESIDSSKTQGKIDDIVSGKNTLIEENKKLRTEINQYQDRVSKSQAKIDELISVENKLIIKNSSLLSEISRYQFDLKSKDEQLRQLEEKAKMSSRGISSYYDFNGGKRETGGGKSSVTVGEEYSIFEKIVDLEKNKKYRELLNLCKQQIQKTPTWLTPYFFIGIAYANLGDKNNAITNFEYVVNNAPGDPDYSEAKEFLMRLKKQK